MKKKNWLCILFTVLIFFAYPTAVYGEEISSDDEDITLAPYFYIKGADPSVDRLPLKETSVTTNINGTIAETYVIQTYANEGENPINASYVFPASTNVTIHGMKMEIGNEVITAQIKEREEAKQEFEQAKSEGKSASLLEQQRPNVFTMDVANIMPGDVVRIELHYTELITPTEGTYQFVFPTVVGPRYVSLSDDTDEEGDEWVASPYLEEGETASGKYDITVNLSTGVPITAVTCSSHEINVAWENESAAQVTLSDSKDFAGDRDFILDYKLTGDKIITGLMLDTNETENFFMLMIQPPERCQLEDIPPREYIFVLDVSGSMNGYPLDTAKELIWNLVSNLRETDHFNLILFSGASVQMAPESLPATEDNIKAAFNLIARQDGSGGTELAPALESALAIPMKDNFSRSIVVITDGYLFGETEIFDIIANNLGTTSFFSFGVGTAVNRYLIEGIAKAGLGEAFVITDPAEAADTAERFRDYIQSPVLTDIHITFDGFEAYDVEPAHLSTLFAQRPIVVFGKWNGEPTGTIRISGKTGSQDYVQEIQVTETTPLEVNNAIRYLWARTRIDQLTDYGFNTYNPEAKAEITAIGLNYSMITPYTSFIAVTDTVRNTEGESTDVDQPLPLPAHVSNLAVGGGYSIGSEPEAITLIVIIVFLLSINCLLRFRISRKRPITAGGIRNDS